MILPTPEQKAQWEAEGYLVFENAIQGEDLKRLQTAFDYWADACKAEWLDRVEAGESVATFYDIPNPLEKDPIFIDIIDYPSYYGALMDFTDHDLILLGPQVRTVAPWPVSYTGWHPDVGQSNPLHIKVQIYVNDVEPGGGEFGFVPAAINRRRVPIRVRCGKRVCLDIKLSPVKQAQRLCSIPAGGTFRWTITPIHHVNQLS